MAEKDKIIAYPFLGSANVDYEYRPITKAAGLPEIIAAEGDEGIGGPAFMKCAYIGRDGTDYTLFYHRVPAFRKNGSKYTDGFGRQVARHEGFIVKGQTDDLSIRISHFDQVHELLTPYFEKFWTHNKKDHGTSPPLLEVKETIAITPEDAQATDLIRDFKQGASFDARPSAEKSIPPSVEKELPSAGIKKEIISSAEHHPDIALPKNARNAAIELGAIAALSGIGAMGIAFTGKKEPEKGKKKWTFAKVTSIGLLATVSIVLTAAAGFGSGNTWAEKISSAAGNIGKRIGL